MYIAMNRFKVMKGAESAFEQVWLSRDTHLDRVPGFLEFHLLRGPERDDHVLYSSHTVWASKDAFTAWTQSEHFRAAHRDAGANKPLYLGHPEFEGFDVLQTIETPKARDRGRLRIALIRLASGASVSFAGPRSASARGRHERRP